MGGREGKWMAYAVRYLKQSSQCPLYQHIWPTQHHLRRRPMICFIRVSTHSSISPLPLSSPSPIPPPLLSSQNPKENKNSPLRQPQQPLPPRPLPNKSRNIKPTSLPRLPGPRVTSNSVLDDLSTRARGYELWRVGEVAHDVDFCEGGRAGRGEGTEGGGGVGARSGAEDLAGEHDWFWIELFEKCGWVLRLELRWCVCLTSRSSVAKLQLTSIT